VPLHELFAEHNASNNDEHADNQLELSGI
jgi:hypothetical protein